MPRYFFHLVHDDNRVPDEEGLHFEDDAVARREGLASLDDLIADTARHNQKTVVVKVEIVRDDGTVLGILTGEIAARYSQP